MTMTVPDEAGLPAAPPPLQERTVSESNNHWLIWNEADWGCQGCDWTGKRVQDFWEAHNIEPGEPAF